MESSAISSCHRFMTSATPTSVEMMQPVHSLTLLLQDFLSTPLLRSFSTVPPENYLADVFMTCYVSKPGKLSTFKIAASINIPEFTSYVKNKRYNPQVHTFRSWRQYDSNRRQMRKKTGFEVNVGGQTYKHVDYYERSDISVHPVIYFGGYRDTLVSCKLYITDSDLSLNSPVCDGHKSQVIHPRSLVFRLDNFTFSWMPLLF